MEEKKALVFFSDDKIDIQKLLTWAKSSKKKKTTTMVIREKKKLDMFKKASDVDAVPIIIEDSKSFAKNENSGVKSSTANSSRFEVRFCSFDFLDVY